MHTINRLQTAVRWTYEQHSRSCLTVFTRFVVSSPCCRHAISELITWYIYSTTYNSNLNNRQIVQKKNACDNHYVFQILDLVGTFNTVCALHDHLPTQENQPVHLYQNLRSSLTFFHVFLHNIILAFQPYFSLVFSKYKAKLIDILRYCLVNTLVGSICLSCPSS